MQKDIENFKDVRNTSFTTQTDSKKTFDLTNHHPDRQFIGYKPLKKGRIFRSKVEKYYPWKSDAPTINWISEPGINQKTKALRELFSVYIKVSLNYLHYQFQRISIPYFDRTGKKRNYQPLGLLTYWESVLPPRNRKCLLIDVWSDSQIKENSEWLIPAFRAANHFAVRRKLRFRVFRDDFFIGDTFSNMIFIEPYMNLKVEETDSSC
ncbi:MAG TPA: hypothetical protein PKY82_34740 [Pyrinomonadaceae bacterium]|nr:hypothetical protein [Pyrinomonadaceae bacterium]